MHRSTLTALAALSLALPAAAQDAAHDWGERNTDFAPEFDAQFRAPIEVTHADVAIETVASGLVHPWAVENLPGDAGYLVTERAGNLRHVSAEGDVSDPIEGLPEIHVEEQGGLLDVEMGPTFEQDRLVYITYSKPTGMNENGATLTATAAGRGTLSEDMTRLEGFEEIWVQTPSAPEPMHYGSRIVFDDSGEHAYITTGERFTFENRPRSQQLSATWGKVARVNLDGSIPEDNPFVDRADAEPSVFSYGHRNVQSAQWVDGELVVAEMGPQGGDEINVVEAGGNYGWPLVSYGERYTRYGGAPIGTGLSDMPGTVQPLYFWDPVISPGDFVVYEGDVFPEWEGDMLIGSLSEDGIVRISRGEDGRVDAEERVATDLGRTRDVEIDDDGAVLILTDYEDGRLVRVTPRG
jgi:glucose/arabinose dehydrogenase